MTSSRSSELLHAANFDLTIDVAFVLPNKVDTRTKLPRIPIGVRCRVFRRDRPLVRALFPGHSHAAERGWTAFALEEPSKTARQARDACLSAADQLVDPSSYTSHGGVSGTNVRTTRITSRTGPLSPSNRAR